MAISHLPLSFYSRAPTQALELDEVERLGLLRLRVLCALAPWPRSNQDSHRDNEALVAFRELVATTANALDDDNPAARARDTSSHYVLRLAFCRTRELSEWFADVETALFGLHLRNRAPLDAVDVLAREGVVYTTTATAHTHQRDTPHKTVDPPVYSVPFQHAWPLVKRRSVRIQRGMCAVPLVNMRCVAQHHFRTAIEQQLRVLQRALPANPLAPRTLARLDATLARFVAIALAHMHGGSTLRNHAAAAAAARERVTPATIDALAVRHFPLCMRHLHVQFRLDHHLKYDGRVQYRLFLKGIGWSIDDTMVHFRNEFTRVMESGVFDKEHAYAIRHSYGLEGARKDYAALSCAQIIHGAAPRMGQYHGCPFRHWDATHLRTELQRGGVASLDHAMQIATHATAAGDPQGACQQFFDATHRRSFADIVASKQQQPQQEQTVASAEDSGRARVSVRHPNTWLDASLQSL